MPFEYEPQGELLVATATGSLTIDDLLSHRDRLVRVREFGVGFGLLMDLRFADSDGLTSDQMQGFAETEPNSPHHPANGVAIVLGRDSDERMAGLLKHYLLCSRHYVTKIRGFQTTDEAVAWLQELRDSPQGGRA